MSEPRNKGVISDSYNPNNLHITSPSSNRPSKIQKTSNITPLITQFDEYNNFPYQQETTNINPGIGSSRGHTTEQESSHQFEQATHQETAIEDEEGDEPFVYYQETHVQESLNTYSLWHARNQAVFEDLIISEADILHRAQSSILAFKQATATKLQEGPCHNHPNPTYHTNQHRTFNHQATLWKKPDLNTYKTNCDANLQIQGRWGLGCITRNSEGHALASATWERSGFDCAATAEAYAILAAMHFVLRQR